MPMEEGTAEHGVSGGFRVGTVCKLRSFAFAGETASRDSPDSIAGLKAVVLTAFCSSPDS